VSCWGVNLDPENKVLFVRRGKYEKDESKRTELENVALELGLEPHRINLLRPNVFGVAAILDVDGHLESPIDVAVVAACNINPFGCRRSSALYPTQQSH
jgi:hypothetical protein